MKFRMQVIEEVDGKPFGNPWWEDCDKPVTDTRQCAEQIIKSFNDTLRPHEKPRRLLAVELLDGGDTAHSWEKTNSATIVVQGIASHDTYRCRKCGITGKRYGLSSSIERDYKFRGKQWASCGNAQRIKEEARQRKIEGGFDV